MTAVFREDKATQVVGLFLATAGGSMDLLKLVKLVYLVDREALVRYGRPVTFDRFFSMVHGPVVSSTLDCMNADPEENACPYWSRYIGAREGNRITLERDAPVDSLSPAEVTVIQDVQREFGAMSAWDLRNYTHTLPEWKQPVRQKRLPLHYRDVLRAGGWAEGEIDEVLQDISAESRGHQVLGT